MNRGLQAFLWSIALIGVMLFTGCGAGNRNFSGNSTAFNFSGYYIVRKGISGLGITSITLTQTGNFARAVDNRGVVYEGPVTPDATAAFDVNDSNTIGSGSVDQGNTSYTQTYTLSGIDGNGQTVTFQLLAQFIFDLTGAEPTDSTSALALSVRLVAMQGYYQDAGGTTGNFIFVINS